MVYLCVQRKTHELKEEVYVSLGSNKGNRAKVLSESVKAMKAFARILASSPIYETPPWGFSSDQPFLNAVIKLETELNPHELLKKLLEVERLHGRDRNEEKPGYEDRTLDLDILFYGDRQINEDRLHIPHRRLEKRKFILVPFCDIAPDFIHPGLNRTVQGLLEDLEDPSQIHKTNYEL
mgnify:CR=1 FL=1